MKIKNISNDFFTLKSGVLEPGEYAEATYEECRVLFSSSKAEHAIEEAPKVAPRKMAAKK